jgi:diguanylate cyclase (GGDEF)-like protein
MRQVLIINSRILTSLSLAGEVKKALGLDIATCNSLKQTSQLLEKGELIHAAVVEPLLEDDSAGEVIDLLLKYKIPVIIYTSALKQELFDVVNHKSILDYIVKTDPNSVGIVINLLAQVQHHQDAEILIVDDSAPSRLEIREMLNSLQLNIIEATGNQDALDKIKEYHHIRLVLIKDTLENENGIHLTCEIRNKYSNKEVSIIGHSTQTHTLHSANFLRNGANDFISKPIQKEDLVNRVLVQLDIINHIRTIKDASEKDFLTSIYNRKYVYEVGSKLFNNAKRGNMTLACAMIDIDHFKKVNDTYGHDIGDKVIIRLAQELSAAFRSSDIVGRLGGEEFCVVLSNPDIGNLENIFDKLRQKIEELLITGRDEHNKKFSLKFTVSIGVTSTLAESFEEMLKFSDMKLYEAKNYGRNMVVI